MPRTTNKPWCQDGAIGGYTALYQADDAVGWDKPLFVCGECFKPAREVWISYLEECKECGTWFSSPWEDLCKNCSIVDYTRRGEVYLDWHKASEMERRARAEIRT